MIDDRLFAHFITFSVFREGPGPPGKAQANARRRDPVRLEMAANRHPDIVLLDISHSKTRGVGAIEVLHSAQPTVPIVAFTPMSSDQYTQAALEAGASACFAKSEMANILLKTMGMLIPNPAPRAGHLLSKGVGL